jgi:hypothetical protein
MSFKRKPMVQNKAFDDEKVILSEVKKKKFRWTEMSM